MLLAVLFTGAFSGYAQNTKEQESRKARLEKEIAIIDRQLKENASQSRSALSSLQLVRTQISKRKALLAESDRQIRILNTEIKNKQADISAMQATLDTMSSYYAKLVKNAYKNRDAKVWYMYILASDNVSQAFSRIGYLRSLSARMNEQAKTIMEKKAELEEERRKLEEMKAKAEVLRKERQKEVSSLQAEETKSNSLVRKLNREKTKYQKELNQKKKQVAALNREIERIIREATKPSSGKKGTSKTVIDTKLDAEFAKNKGKLPWPADGPVVDKYGQRNHPVYKGVKLPFNNGITIALEPSTHVKAVFDGLVKQIVVMPGYNKCVLVQHGNYFSFYCKLGDVNVKAGDKVRTGDVIGTVDTIGGDTQLHLQIWKGTTPQNPELWLK